MLLELGIAVGGGLLNALSGSAEDREMEQRKQRAMELLKENIIDPDELDLMLDNVNRLFNNRLINTLNSTALRSRGVANSATVKGVVSAGIESARLNTLADVNFKTMESNKQTRAQLANLETAFGGQHNFFGDFVGGALAAAPVGIELSKMLAPTGINPGGSPNTLATADPYNYNPSAKNINNPFLNKFKIEDEDIYNFGYSKFFNRNNING